MLAIMLLRPSCDRIFEWLKMSSAFAQMTFPGPAATINALVIAMAINRRASCSWVVLVAPLLAWLGCLFTAAVSLLRAENPSGGLQLFLTLTTYAAVFALRRRLRTTQLHNVASSPMEQYA